MSLDLVQLDQRLSSVEEGLTRVQQRLGLIPPAVNWVDQISGSLADIPEDDYQRFLECCRAVRQEGSVSEAEEPRP